MNGIMEDAQWRAVQRESQLAAAQAAHGVTLLGKANHTQIGLYTQAFFALSVGLERTGKLIFLADHAIKNQGTFPKDQDMRAIGHDLYPLLKKCEQIGSGLSQERYYAERPSHEIHRGIECVISLFATKLRYYNLNHLAGSAQDQQDPVALWWEKVGAPICDRHYNQKKRQNDEAVAVRIDALLRERSVVAHSNEAGDPIRDIRALHCRGRETAVVQKKSQLYALQIVRWLSSIIHELSCHGAYEKRIQALFGMHEPFVVFMNDDSFLRKRKRWSIYP